MRIAGAVFAALLLCCPFPGLSQECSRTPFPPGGDLVSAGVVEFADAALTWPGTGHFLLRVTAVLPVHTRVEAVLRDGGGSDILRFPLLDDGLHEDGGRDDGRYANESGHAAFTTGADLFLELQEQDKSTPQEILLQSMLPLVGEVRVEGTGILSDHMDFNGEAAPGENVVFGIRIVNQAVCDLGPWTIVTAQPGGDTKFARFCRTVGAGQSTVLRGFDDGLEEALSMDIPASAVPGSEITVAVALMSDQYCLWNDTVRIPVHALSRSMQSGLLAHVRGPATGSLAYTVAEPAALNGHALTITVEGEDGGPKTLKVDDVTEGRTLFDGLPLPDRYGHRSPDFAGLRVSLGSAVTEASDGAGNTVLRPPIWRFDRAERAWFTPVNLDYGSAIYGSSVDVYGLFPVELVFDRAVTQKGYAYLRSDDAVYSYEGYHDCPVRAYDMRDADVPRQLNIFFVERNGRSAHDNRWFPSTDPGDWEYLFILGDDYSEIPDPAYAGSIPEIAPRMPLLYGICPVLNPDAEMFSDGDRFRIDPQIPVSRRDMYLLDGARLLGQAAVSKKPDEVVLFPGYPNPAVSVATIAYRIGAAGHVELTLHDMLGRTLRTLVSGWREAGTHVARMSLDSAPPGVYFCRLRTGGVTATQRLLILR